MKIGLMLPIGQQELLAGPDRWSLFRDMALAADASGLDSVWCADHLLFRHDEATEPGGTDGIHEAWTILSAVAAITTRVEIGPLVLCVPFRNPALTAKMATTLDEVSGGRLDPGARVRLARAGVRRLRLRVRPPRRASSPRRSRSSCRCCAPGPPRSTAAGSAPPTPGLVPPGPRPNGPPILIAGKRPRMLDLVARHADAWNAAWYGHPDDAHELRERITRLHAALDAVGRPRDSLELTAGIFVATAPADDDRPDEAITGGDRRDRARRSRATRRSGSATSSSTCWPTDRRGGGPAGAAVGHRHGNATTLASGRRPV